MPRRAPWTEGQAKVVKTCNKTGGISARIGRTVKETAAIFGKTTEIFEPIVRICDETRGGFVMTGNNCSMMNTLGPAQDIYKRTGKISVTTVKISKAIVGS